MDDGRRGLTRPLRPSSESRQPGGVPQVDLGPSWRPCPSHGTVRKVAGQGSATGTRPGATGTRPPGLRAVLRGYGGRRARRGADGTGAQRAPEESCMGGTPPSHSESLVQIHAGLSDVVQAVGPGGSHPSHDQSCGVTVGGRGPGRRGGPGSDQGLPGRGGGGVRRGGIGGRGRT